MRPGIRMRLWRAIGHLVIHAARHTTLRENAKFSRSPPRGDRSFIQLDVICRSEFFHRHETRGSRERFDPRLTPVESWFVAGLTPVEPRSDPGLTPVGPRAGVAAPARLKLFPCCRVCP